MPLQLGRNYWQYFWKDRPIKADKNDPVYRIELESGRKMRTEKFKTDYGSRETPIIENRLLNISKQDKLKTVFKSAFIKIVYSTSVSELKVLFCKLMQFFHK